MPQTDDELAKKYNTGTSTASDDEIEKKYAAEAKAAKKTSVEEVSSRNAAPTQMEIDQRHNIMGRGVNALGAAFGPIAGLFGHDETASPATPKLKSANPNFEGNPEEGGFNQLGHMAGEAWKGAKGLVGGAYEMGKDLVSPMPWLMGKPGEETVAEKYLFKPSEAETIKAGEALNRNDYIGAGGHALASAIPLVGPWAASLGEQAGTGDIHGAAGNILGTAGAGELGNLGMKGISRAGEYLPSLKATDTGLGLEPPVKHVGDIFRGEPLRNLRGGSFVGKNNLDYDQAAKDAEPDLQAIASKAKADNKMPTSPREAVDLLNDSINGMDSPIRKMATNIGPRPLTDAWAKVEQRVTEALSRNSALLPEEVKKAYASVKSRFDAATQDFGKGRELYAPNAEDVRKWLNDELDKYYKMTPASKAATRISDADVEAYQAAATALRDILYDTYDKVLQDRSMDPNVSPEERQKARDDIGQTRTTRKREGNLLKVRDALSGAINRAEKAGHFGSLENLGRSSLTSGIGATLPAVLGLLMGHGAAAIGLPVFGAKMYFDWRRNPNVQVENAFKSLANRPANAPSAFHGIPETPEGTAFKTQSQNENREKTIEALHPEVPSFKFTPSDQRTFPSFGENFFNVRPTEPHVPPVFPEGHRAMYEAPQEQERPAQGVFPSMEPQEFFPVQHPTNPLVPPTGKPPLVSTPKPPEPTTPKGTAWTGPPAKLRIRKPKKEE